MTYEHDFQATYALLGEPLGVWRARFEFVPWKRLAVPLWPLAIGACIWMIVGIRRLDGERCPCGYALAGLRKAAGGSVVCPECGRAHAPLEGATA